MNDVWVTGGNGFFGRHIVGQLGKRALVTPRSRVDLLDFPKTLQFIKEGDFDFIVHAAGFVGGIGLNKDHPGRMAADNLRMGLNVLEGAARVGGKHVVVVSTVCVYPENAPIPTPESAIYDGYPSEVTSFYGLAKRELLSLAQGLSREFGLSFTYLIPTNLYGPGDHFEEEKSHVVPALLKRAIESKEASAQEMVVWGDGSQTRDLLFVEDAAKAIELALDKRHNGQVFNLSSGRETSVKELVETICRLVDYEGKLVWDVTKPGGAPRRALDGSKAKVELGFEAKTSLEEGLQKTLDWYQKARA
jgi:GDP-L-fucose synthase